MTDAQAIGASFAEPEVFALLFDRHFEAVHGYVQRRVGPTSPTRSPRRPSPAPSTAGAATTRVARTPGTVTGYAVYVASGVVSRLDARP